MKEEVFYEPEWRAAAEILMGLLKSHEKWLLNPDFPFLPLVEKMVQNVVNKTQVSEAILIFSCL